MAYFDREEDTICAVTTGAGQSGIAVIRVSGPEALLNVKQLCTFIPESPESHRVYYGLIKDSGGTHSIDEVLVSYFAEGKSYTGEETCEISCHGNPVIASQILSQLVALGCRPADRGEFTFRSFMNGRIDLVQAESVLALIDSTSKKASRLALEQLRGQLSRLFQDLERDIIWILSRLEAGIDFSAEGIEIIDELEVRERLSLLIETCRRLIQSYQTGRLLSEGIKIVLVGRPNAGKSSLLNALIRTERAIVSTIPGTTRDTIEASYKVNGVTATLVDTAGLRETSDEIEKLGVERSHQQLEASDLLLFVIDAKDCQSSFEDLKKFRHKKILAVLNKIDLLKLEELKELENLFFVNQTPFVSTSLLTSAGESRGLFDLEKKLSETFAFQSVDESTVVIHARHERNLRLIHEALVRADAGLEQKMSSEFICLDLRDALLNIGKILGRELGEDVITQIFKDFCIGK